VIGRFTEQSEFTEDDSLNAILNQYLSDASFPVFTNADFGHSDPLFTIPHGGTARLDSADKSITFAQAVE
jgi:muramoyltetrapeptide carboxypeptidase